METFSVFVYARDLLLRTATTVEELFECDVDQASQGIISGKLHLLRESNRPDKIRFELEYPIFTLMLNEDGNVECMESICPICGSPMFF